MTSAWRLTDLDCDPHFMPDVLALVRRTARGRDHIVAGDLHRIGNRPAQADFLQAQGVLLAVALDSNGSEFVVGVLGLYAYSGDQMTVWGPAVHPGWVARGVGTDLWLRARQALSEAGYVAVRTVVDERNRNLRSFWLARGMRPWKDNLIYQKALREDLHAATEVFCARRDDHPAVSSMLAMSFPEASHLDQTLAEREEEGYRYWVLQDSGHLVAVAVLTGTGSQSWLHLLAVAVAHRGKGFGRRLLAGALAAEYQRGSRLLSLEVLADNRPACALYESQGMHKRWSTRVLTGPVLSV